MTDNRFWSATERAEQEFTGVGDVRAFRKRMRALGHENEAIRERVEAIHPSLLARFDRLVNP